MIRLNSRSEIQELLIKLLLSSVKVPNNDLDPDAPFSRYGLAS